MKKKDKIKAEALILFSNDGYNAVSTAKIAKQAVVSEGLIFKHFKSKKGLLDNIYFDVGEKIGIMFMPVLEEMDPIKVIEKYIDTIFIIDQADYPFWKLIFKLKWDNDFYQPDEMKPIIDKLSWAFKNLDYPKPNMEATMLVHTIENLAISILRDGLSPNKKMQSFLKKKYKS